MRRRDTSRSARKVRNQRTQTGTRKKLNAVVRELRKRGNPRAVGGMARYGINPKNAFGVSIPQLRSLAGRLGKDHVLARHLWGSGVHEARILASMIDDADYVTERQMDKWVKDFDSWDVCDQCCLNLFFKTRFAYRKSAAWSASDKEFVKRAAFALMACLAVHGSDRSDERFLNFLRLIERAASDKRNYVKKAVNWALRQIGKRNLMLNKKAILAAERIRRMDAPSARWIAADALRELRSDAVQRRLRSL